MNVVDVKNAARLIKDYCKTAKCDACPFGENRQERGWWCKLTDESDSPSTWRIDEEVGT